MKGSDEISLRSVAMNKLLIWILLALTQFIGFTHKQLISFAGNVGCDDLQAKYK